MGCGLLRAASLLDRLRFVGFYCLPAFVGARSHCNNSSNSTPPPPSPSSSLPPRPTSSPASPAPPCAACSRRRRAGGGSSAHSGLGDSKAAQSGELERLLSQPLRYSHTGTRTTAVAAARGRGGVKVLGWGSSTLIYVSGTAWRRVQSRAN